MGETKIVIVDRGWVYVGEYKHEKDFLIITNAQNIRQWGTTRGLGQLALEGPTPSTRLDLYGIVRVPLRAVISVIDTESKLWSTSK